MPFAELLLPLTRSLSFQVFRKINKNLPTLTLLELQYVSPKLLAVKDLDLAIPGKFSPLRLHRLR